MMDDRVGSAGSRYSIYEVDECASIEGPFSLCDDNNRKLLFLGTQEQCVRVRDILLGSPRCSCWTAQPQPEEEDASPRQCAAKDPTAGSFYICTLDEGHDGNHIAWASIGQRRQLANWSVVPAPAEKQYPCAECGVMRSKDEGGTTFTVCDGCWDKSHAKPVVAPSPAPAEPYEGLARILANEWDKGWRAVAKAAVDAILPQAGVRLGKYYFSDVGLEMLRSRAQSLPPEGEK